MRKRGQWKLQSANGCVLFKLVPQSIHDISLIFHLTHISLAYRACFM